MVTYRNADRKIKILFSNAQCNSTVPIERI
jgi:hypothetical protein